MAKIVRLSLGDTHVPRNCKPRMLFGDAKHNFNANEKPISRSDVTASDRLVMVKRLSCQRFRLILFLLCSLKRNIRTDRQWAAA